MAQMRALADTISNTYKWQAGGTLYPVVAALQPSYPGALWYLRAIAITTMAQITPSMIIIWRAKKKARTKLDTAIQ